MSSACSPSLKFCTVSTIVSRILLFKELRLQAQFDQACDSYSNVLWVWNKLDGEAAAHEGPWAFRERVTIYCF
jgi:hypothetical protein